MSKQKNPDIAGKLMELEKRLAGQEKQAMEFKETAQRVQADFENFAKRNEKEKEEFKKFAEGKLIAEFLPVMDSFNDAIASTKKHKSVSKKEVLQGLELLKKQFFGVFEKHGLKEIKASGKKFDPHFHECILKEHDKGKEDEVVLKEIQKGYLLNDKVLRISKVKINKLEEEK